MTRGRQRLAIRAAAALVAIPLAFSARAQGRGAFTVRDSAGVRIVESTRPALDSAHAWRLDPTPAVSIGREGDTLYQFTSVQAVGRMSDGAIVVADGGPEGLAAAIRRVSYYDAAGRFLRAIGRPGQGPNEFPQPFLAAFLCGDSVFVRPRDSVGRLVVVAATPAIARVAERPAGPGAYRTRDLTACGRDRFVWSLSGAATPSGFGFHWYTGNFAIADASGRWLGTLLDVPVGEGFQAAIPGRSGAMSLEAPFAARFSLAVTASGVAIAGARSYEISLYGNDGARRMVLRVPRPLRYITKTERDRAFARAVDSARSDAARIGYETMFADPGFPDVMPAVGALLADARDNLWVREYDEADALPGGAQKADHERHWAVFAPDGHLITRLTTPPRFEAGAIGDDYLIGVFYDADDVPLIRVYRLRKTAGGDAS
jgi:hypothetical protein